TPDIDSANSAAPGFTGQDWQGLIREDDPDVANTGAGPIPYADRGAAEVVGEGSVAVTLSPNSGPTVTGNVTQTAARWAPARILSSQRTYGDGSAAAVVPLGQPASHTYQSPGVYGVSVIAFDSGGVHAGGSILPYTWTVNTALAATT